MSQRPSIDLRLSANRNVSPWARAAFETAQYAAKRGDLAEARSALLRALDTEPDFIDAHYALAQVTSDPAEKRAHLAEVLMAMPNHLDALRELMVLDGRLSAADAERTHHFNDAEIRTAEAPVRTQTSALACPVCGGDLTVDPDDHHVECRFCGYRAAAAPRADGVGDLLAAALLQRKADPVRWKIGGRLLHCNACGAERTIPASALSDRCPFCNANHVVQQDALASFQQPDALLRFTVSPEAADTRVRQRLSRLDQRLSGMIDTNAVHRLELDGVYLPFWAFDVLADITQTFTPKSRSIEGRLQQIEQANFRDGLHDVIVAGVGKPQPSLTQQLAPFDFEQAVQYAPKLLARYPAALYDVDFDNASMTARSAASREFRARHSHTTRSNVEVSVSSNIVQMSFRLLLLPVWVGVITEVDGDLRQVLVNGQTGKVVLGRTHKRKK
jgi:tetratricopeptide (TPR) repeat protein